MSKFKPNARIAAAIAKGPPLKFQTVKSVGSAGSVTSAGAVVDAAELEAVSPASLAFQSSAQRFALNAALVFFFFRISFLHEFITGHIGIDLHMMIVLGGICYVGCIISGSALSALYDRCTWTWVAFAVWMIICTATSIWPGGSVFETEGYLKTIFPIIFIIPAAVTMQQDVDKFMAMIGLAGIGNTALGFLSGDFKSGRMGIEAAGSIGDPNDYAAHLIFLIPAIAYYAFSLKKSAFYKILGTGSIAAAIYQILSTGSRGGLVSLMAFAGYVIFTGNHKVRIAMLLGGPTLVLLALPLVPQSSVDRLTTLFSSQTNEKSEEAEASSNARRLLFHASLDATLSHPIFGIGPGVFEDYEAGIAAESGRKGMWHGTHNAYTEISSECGIPGLLFVVAGLVFTFKYLRKVKKLGEGPLPGAATTLSVMLFGFCVAIFFLTKGYNFNFLIVSGLAIALKRMLPGANPA